jgi:two-component system chemotaxis response regulator CheY
MLVVDDSAVIRKILRSQLLHLGYNEVFEARDGGEALFQLQDKKPDLVFLDIHMPDLDGRTFMKEMRSNPELADIPVIVVTADSSPGQTEVMVNLGARYYLTKPFSADKLRTAIEKATRPKE